MQRVISDCITDPQCKQSVEYEDPQRIPSELGDKWNLLIRNKTSDRKYRKDSNDKEYDPRKKIHGSLIRL